MTDIRGHVLVVDDNPLNRKLLARAVEKQGCQVTTAAERRRGAGVAAIHRSLAV